MPIVLALLFLFCGCSVESVGLPGSARTDPGQQGAPNLPPVGVTPGYPAAAVDVGTVADDSGMASPDKPALPDAGTTNDSSTTCPVEMMLASGSYLAPALAADDTYLYWIKWRPATEQGLYRTPKVGGPSMLLTGNTEYYQNGSTGSVDVAVDDNNVYYTSSGYVDVCCDRDGAIVAVPKAGGLTFVIAGALGEVDPACASYGSPTYRAGHPGRIRTDGKYVFWTETLGTRWCPGAPAAGRILAAPTTGGGVMMEIARVSAGTISVDATSVYWSEGQGLMVSDKSGAGRSALTTTAGSGVALDATKVYFATLSGSIYSIAKSGGTPTLLSAPSASTLNDDTVWDIVVDGGQVFWSSSDSKSGGSHIQRVGTDGTDWQVLQHVGGRLAIDANYLYWNDGWNLNRSCR